MEWKNHPETRRLAALFAKVIEDAMEATGTTTAEMATALDLSQRRIRYMLSGDHVPTLQTVARALHHLGYQLQIEAVRAGPVAHEFTLGYTADDDGVWLSCTCGWSHNLGHEATPAEVILQQGNHLADVETAKWVEA